MNHIWLVKLHRKADKDALGKTGGLQVKGGLCAVIDHIQQDVTVKVHWVDFAVQNESFRQVLSNFGDVLEISNDNWSVAGFEHETSTTRVVRMRLKEGVVLDDLPHLFKFGSCSVLLVAPGRSPLCLRCRRQGHIRRDCQTPRFGVCRVFGHESQDCARSYGRVTQTIIPTDDVQENIMDAEEAEKSAPNSNIKEHVGEVQDTDAKIAGGTMPDSQDLTKATEERAETVCTQEAPLLSQASEEEDLSDCTETTTEEEKADATGATAARGKRLRTGIPKLTEERTERKVKRLERQHASPRAGTRKCVKCVKIVSRERGGACRRAEILPAADARKPAARADATPASTNQSLQTVAGVHQSESAKPLAATPDDGRRCEGADATVPTPTIVRVLRTHDARDSVSERQCCDTRPTRPTTMGGGSATRIRAAFERRRRTQPAGPLDSADLSAIVC
ncbi:hypothetical protein HPB49_025983 [Dermacentor silvarum]|nr:hypothetical protein HPB49_025983 [Dermacentor silvarum]